MAVVREHGAATAVRYSRVAMALHWLIAACFAFQLGLGWRMEGPQGPAVFAAYQLHKSLGITILALTIVRLVWRLTRPAPAFPPTMKPWERALAHATHIGFYALLLGLTLTGWLLVSSSKTGVPTILYGILPFPHFPGVAEMAAAPKAGLNEASEAAHHWLVWIAYALIALHLLGALKHQFVERGADLQRMLPAPRHALAPALIVAVAALFGVATFGKLVPLTPIVRAPAAPVVTEAAAPVAEVAPEPAAEAPVVDAPAEVANETAPAEAVKPSAWTVRKAVSTLAFKTNWSQGAIDGRFRSWTAAITFDPKALDASSVDVTIDMASATTGVADTENALPGADWFDVASHPTAKFQAKSFRHRGGDRYEAKGTLTLRGASRPLTLPFTLKIDGDVATMSGSATVDRIAFGVGQGEWKSTAEVPAGVTMAVSIKADRKK